MGRRRRGKATVTNKQQAESKGSKAPAAATTEEEKSLYFCVRPLKTLDYIWYVANGTDGEGPQLAVQESSLFPELTSIPSRHGLKDTAMAVWGSKIYFIGGLGVDKYHSCHDEVHVFDTLTREWTQGTSMNQRRRGAAAVAAAGRIYVFGDTRSWNDCYKEELTIQLWAQYYDVDSQSWNPVPGEPPQELYDGFSVNHCEHHELGSTIYLWLRDQIEAPTYSYNYVTTIWKHHPSGIIGKPHPSNPHTVIVGNVFYRSNEGAIYAYDLAKQQDVGSKLVYAPRPADPHSPSYRSLVYLGKNYLCVVGFQAGPGQKLLCHTFRIDASSPEAGLVRVTDGDGSFTFPDYPPLFKVHHLICR